MSCDVRCMSCDMSYTSCDMRCMSFNVNSYECMIHFSNRHMQHIILPSLPPSLPPSPPHSPLTPFFRDIMPAVRKNREREKSRSAYDPSLFTTRLTPFATYTYVCTNMDICASMRTNSSCPSAVGEAWF